MIDELNEKVMNMEDMFEDSSNCSNAWGSDCRYYKSDCSSDWFEPYIKYCKKTCNKCPTPI